MAPILIDSRDLLKLASISILVTALVFTGGYFLGHQRAATFYQAGSEVQSLSLPEPIEILENIAGSKLPSTIEAGENIDVDQPESVVLQNNITANSMPDSIAASSAVMATSSEDKKLPVSLQAKGVSYNSRMIANVIDSSDASIVSAINLDELSKIKYSLQVGMYGRLINAENMVKMLKAKHYDAYVSDYTNKENEIRYNVRVGYFSDKKSAKLTLNKFKAEQNGDGYLVNFSADHVVNIAKSTEVKRASDIPARENKIDKILLPVSLSSDVVQEISQADVINNTILTAN